MSIAHKDGMTNGMVYGLGIALFIAVKFTVPGIIEGFSMLGSEPAAAFTLILQRLVGLGIICGIAYAVYRFGVFTVLLFLINPMMAWGLIKAKTWYREEKAKSQAEINRFAKAQPKPQPTPEPAPRPHAKHQPARAVQPGTPPRPIEPKRPVMTVSDLGPKKGDRFASSPISSRRRGLFG